jgi:hypothetical protein
MSNNLKASDVFIPDFLSLLVQQGLEVMDPRKRGAPIFKFDKEGNPTAMVLRARTAKAYKTFSGGGSMPLGGAGAELWMPIPKAGEGDSANLRKFMTPKYSGNKPKESGPEGRVGPALKPPTYGSGWRPDESSVPEAGSTGDRGAQSGGEVQVTPAMPEDIEVQEDEALDVNFENNSPLPSGGFGVNIREKGKKADFMLQRLHHWLVKNGHEHEADKIMRWI